MSKGWKDSDDPRIIQVQERFDGLMFRFVVLERVVYGALTGLAMYGVQRLLG